MHARPAKSSWGTCGPACLGDSVDMDEQMNHGCWKVLEWDGVLAWSGDLRETEGAFIKGPKWGKCSWRWEPKQKQRLE